MKIFKSSQVKLIDEYTIKNEPIESIDLMERAASTITDWIVHKYPTDKKISIFIGPGNNGGDGLAVARQLFHTNFTNIHVYILRISEHLSPDAEINLKSLYDHKQIPVIDIHTKEDLPELHNYDVIIDALFGSGLSRELDGLAKETVEHLNNSKGEIISVDIPSGLMGEDNSNNNPEAIIQANYTLSLQFPNLSFFHSENNIYVGDWEVLPIGLHPDAIKNTETPYYTVSLNEIKKNLLKRDKFSHKGTYGHSLLISGSYGKMGAAILSAKACLRSGCGLLTVHIPQTGYQILQTSVPEAMLNIDYSEIIISSVPELNNFSAIGVGPGIGTKPNTKKAIQEILANTEHPIVIDADGLNIIAEENLLDELPENSILTPHPREFERLFGSTDSHYDRVQKQIENAIKYKIFIVLKGAHTSIVCPDGTCYFNITGNPGMATAGSGDVLTGIILSLLGQGYDSKWAAIIGVYIHGLAGDLAIKNQSCESLIASDIIEHLGAAFNELI